MQEKNQLNQPSTGRQTSTGTITMYIRHHALYFAWTVALVAMLGSLYFSEVQHIIPCTLCWYQRIVMYPLVVLIAIGILKNDHDVKHYLLPLSSAGVVIGAYQVALQQGWVKDIEVCSAAANCAAKQSVLLHAITIPMLSLFAFVVITVALMVHEHYEELETGKGNK